MAHDDASNATGAKRRWTFVGWVVASILVTAYLLIAAPFAEMFHEAHWLVAIAVPALMAFFLITGLGWLIYLNTGKRSARTGQPSPRELQRHR